MAESLKLLSFNVDRMMGVLLALEWLAAIAIALWLKPEIWQGMQPHLLLVLVAGSLLAGLPAVQIGLYPFGKLNRHAVAVSQIVLSTLLIDVAGGRVESHLHILVSLAILASYLDWRVLATASAVTVVCHVAGGVWWPESLFSMANPSRWSWAEHGWWVALENSVLIFICKHNLEMRRIQAGKDAGLSYAATHDLLTGLANRCFLFEKVSPVVSSGGKGAILLVDLDRFKHVNDTLGHSTANRLLTLIGERVSALRRPGDILARVDGDEFVLWLDGADAASARVIADAILAGFTEPFDVDNVPVMVSASIGVSLSPGHGSTLLAINEAAELAMHEAKSQGRNHYRFFLPSMAGRNDTNRVLTRDIHSAIWHKELKVHFQPQLKRNGSMKGFEALMRWHHPSLGEIPPTVFISIAEEAGIIDFLGEWILRESCRCCKTWQEAGFPGIGVAVNVSALQFEDGRFADKVAYVLDEAGLPASLLTVELTETVMLQSVPHVLRQIDRLREMGVEIALDDFGTGYSSLHYLEELNIHCIKLDKSFVTRSLAKNPSMIEAVLDMAHRIGLRVTCEGVETEEQVRMLEGMGCDFFQGYYYGRPMASEQVIPFLAATAGNSYPGPELTFPAFPSMALACPGRIGR